MQMIEDALMPDQLDRMRKVFEAEDEALGDKERAQRVADYLRQRRDEAMEADDRNRHERRAAAALERLRK